MDDINDVLLIVAVLMLVYLLFKDYVREHTTVKYDVNQKINDIENKIIELDLTKREYQRRLDYLSNQRRVFYDDATKDLEDYNKFFYTEPDHYQYSDTDCGIPHKFKKNFVNRY